MTEFTAHQHKGLVMRELVLAHASFPTGNNTSTAEGAEQGAAKGAPTSDGGGEGGGNEGGGGNGGGGGDGGSHEAGRGEVVRLSPASVEVDLEAGLEQAPAAAAVSSTARVSVSKLSVRLPFI